MSEVIVRLKGQLIVSSQAMDPLSPLRAPETLALMAEAAALGGAGGFRVDGPAVVRLLRARSPLPIIGIAKATTEGFDNYITTTLEDVQRLVAAGADIIAIQATSGTRPGPSFAELASAAHNAGALVMADIATSDEARRAVDEGANLIASTMVGHTTAPRGAPCPPVDLLRQ